MGSENSGFLYLSSDINGYFKIRYWDNSTDNDVYWTGLNASIGGVGDRRYRAFMIGVGGEGSPTTENGNNEHYKKYTFKCISI